MSSGDGGDLGGHSPASSSLYETGALSPPWPDRSGQGGDAHLWSLAKVSRSVAHEDFRTHSTFELAFDYF